MLSVSAFKSPLTESCDGPCLWWRERRASWRYLMRYRRRERRCLGLEKGQGERDDRTGS